MCYLNKVMLMGNLTRDPELRATPKGTKVCTVGMAMNRVYYDANRQKHEEVTYVELEAWGSPGEIIAKYLKKGQPTMIEGHLKFHAWDDKQSGQKRNKLTVVVETVQLLPAGSRTRSEAPAATEPVEEVIHAPSDDVPF